jgi:hypothetical protein
MLDNHVAVLGMMALLIVSYPGAAIVAGPFNVTCGLSEFQDISVSGPIGVMEGGFVAYQIEVAKGNESMPSTDIHVPKLMIQINKYSIPVDIDDYKIREAFYDSMTDEIIPAHAAYTKDHVIVDSQTARVWHVDGYDILSYFVDPNTQIMIGVFELSPQEYRTLCRSFRCKAI